MKKKLLLAIFTLVISLSVGLMPTVLAQTNKDAVCEGVGLTGGSCDAPGPDDPSLTDTIALVINIFSIVIGVTAVIMIMIGGFRYITSGGDANSTGAAKNTILYAVIGLVIVAVAQLLVRFVLNLVT